MNMLRKSGLLWIFIFSCTAVFSQKKERVEYKQIGDSIQLFMEVVYPEKISEQASLPAIIFFYGGGWKGGGIAQFQPHAEYFSQRGLVCFLAQYRVEKRHHSTPFQSLEDAKSAVRFVRAHAGRFRIDPDSLVAAGGSAGGHLAAATALVDGFNAPNDDLSVSCQPDALVLFNPVIDNGPAGYGYDRVGDRYRNFSPLHNISEGAPPTIFFLGTRDQLVPVETAGYYQKAMERVGSRCDLILYEGEEHAFFNYGQKYNYYQTVIAADQFLQSLGYLKGEPTLQLDP